MNDEDKTRRLEALKQLRAAVKGTTGLKATLVCTAISHARHKKHCRTYKLYNGGWAKTWSARTAARHVPDGWELDDHAQKYLNKFSEDLQQAERHNYYDAMIFDLNDQAVFLKKFVEEDDARVEKLQQYEKAGRTIYTWMRPHLTDGLRAAIRTILDVTEVEAHPAPAVVVVE